MKLPVPPIMVFFVSIECHWIEEGARDVPTSNGRPVDWCQVGICFCFLDDGVMFLRTPDDRICQVEQELMLLNDASVTKI